MSFGGGENKSTGSTVQNLSPEQQRLMSLVEPVAKDFIKNPPTVFPGSTLAPINQQEISAQNEALSAAGNVQNLAQATSAAHTNVLDDSELRQRLMSDISLSPHLAAATEAATRPIIQAHERSVLPGIRGEAIMTNNFGSTRQGIAEGIASEGLLRTVGDTGATFANQAFRDVLGAETERLGIAQAGRDATSRAIALAPSTAGLLLEPARIQSAVGGAQRADAQALLTEQVNKFLAKQVLPFSAAQEVAGLAMGIPAGSVNSMVTGTGTTGPSDMQKALGLGASGAAIGGQMGGPVGAGIGAGLGALLAFMD
tara:strand:+ start:6104 stop:7039 length:936 start_codon:yes stop_codon:yes gene_type:complete